MMDWLPVRARDVKCGQTLLDEGYPAEIVAVRRTPSGLVNLIFSDDPCDQAIFSPDATLAIVALS